MTETHAPVLIRMPIEQKERLVQEAKKHSRTLTGEVNERLRISLAAHGPTLQGILAREQAAKDLPASYTAANTPVVNHTNDNGPASALTDIDRAMLTVFHQLPPEKQLALLSLFR